MMNQIYEFRGSLSSCGAASGGALHHRPRVLASRMSATGTSRTSSVRATHDRITAKSGYGPRHPAPHGSSACPRSRWHLAKRPKELRGGVDVTGTPLTSASRLAVRWRGEPLVWDEEAP